MTHRLSPAAAGVPMIMESAGQAHVESFLRMSDGGCVNHQLYARIDCGGTAFYLCFEHGGGECAWMELVTERTGKRYEYPADIYRHHMQEYMRGQIKALEQKVSFDGTEYITAFYNEIILTCRNTSDTCYRLSEWNEMEMQDFM